MVASSKITPSPHQTARSRFGSILEEHGVPFFLKVDIEGNDILCVRDLTKGDLPAYMSVEATDLELLEALRDAGFERFKLISQFNFVPVEIPTSQAQRSVEMLTSKRLPARIFRRLGGQSLLRRQIMRSAEARGWRFPEGSSGPFGEDLAGRWLDFDESKRVYEAMLAKMRSGERSPYWPDTDKSYSFWVDWHARR